MATAKNGKNTKKKTTNSKKTAAKTNSKKNINGDRRDDAARSQFAAIVLFAVSILLICIVLIPGGAVWGALRNLMFGLFGVSSYIWPLVLIYIAIMTTKDKVDSNVSYKVIESALLIVLISSAIHVFGFDGDTQVDYLHGVSDAYNQFKIGGNVFGSGAIGAVLGGAVLLITGSSKPAAIAIVLILLFVSVMLITGTTLIKFIRGIVNPVKKVSKMTGEQVHNRFNLDREEESFEDSEPELPEEDILVTIEEANKKRKQKKQIDLSEKNDVPKEQEIPAAVEPLNSKPVQLDDIIKNLNSKPDEISHVVTEESSNEKKEEIKAEDVSLAENDMDEGTDETETVEYNLPPLDILAMPKNDSNSNYEEELKQNATKLVDTLKSFGVETRVVDISRGPSVTRYEIQPAAGVKISRITNLSDDIALNLAASGVRIEAPIPNKAAVGIEVPNKNRSTVTFRELIDTDLYKKAVNKSKLSIALGKDIAGNCTFADIAKMPHLLVCGTTGSGKSVCLNSMIVSILYNAKPDEVKLLMIDPKQVEFTIYNGIPHLLVPVVSDARKASGALSWAVGEMLQRYKKFADNNVRDINGYNSICESIDQPKMPQIVIFIDELSDLMMAAPHEVEDSICRLAQMARAAGMHLVIATQRPSVDVITGLIKSNIPSRLSLKTSSQIDSRTIIDAAGAEKLLGNGDMLFYPVGIAKPVRIQGCYLSDKEVENVVEYIKSQVKTEYDDDVIQEIERQAAMDKKKNGGTADLASDGDDSADEMLPKAIEVVVENQMASTTLLQRKLKLGYARAARIIDDLEERGIVGPYEGSKPRKVLITKQQWLEMNALASGGTVSVPTDNAPVTAEEDVLTVDGNE